MTSPDRLAQLKKQVEWYMCDDNLKFDSFFQEKIRANPDGWLAIDHILACPKMKALSAQTEEVIEALKESHLETKVEEGKSLLRRPPTQTLPELQPRPSRKPDKATTEEKQNAAGVIVKISGVPAEASWQDVKTAVIAAAKEKGGVTQKNPVLFCSQVSSEGFVTLVFQPFPDATAIVKSLTLEVNKKALTINVLSGEEAGKALKSLPKFVQDERQKAAKRAQQQAQGRGKGSTAPIKVGGIKFNNIGDVRSRCKSILNTTPDDKLLDPSSTEYTLVCGVLDYHPNAEGKKKGMTGLKVSTLEKGGATSRCFFVVREDGEPAEDFSISKCLDTMMNDPPFIGPNGHVLSKRRQSEREGDGEEKEPGEEAVKKMKETNEEDEKKEKAAAVASSGGDEKM
uniref:HTH La-type RNA-binding domain-containing protein n=1 Tax=Chromera velia CCMP2878 TaxID=1169474 RepID=A0A0G4GRF9_9ALVE|mmetsp:Transcript_33103/g.65700  ORF Transcript_33103/g.65700 Transcript_33103/m.65700 type:complete len:398 (+) Transcript_33103:202-1395(+)|eukprot:Cvel_23051.t1-p1 / transcript=Cvel_23051.t1 / gene=Cvel_23051 / organism=Chromera_velia_CCMP2878 / gene_product=Lupus La protein homolog A, putative / transcript_product=Lupus La protein homolog A, putative / location=Cvel_scaffold2332:20361-21551(+) / protein_length=397 / sequence_SO=supercontig / SO=protein_coding / is_pseudo=false